MFEGEIRGFQNELEVAKNKVSVPERIRTMWKQNYRFLGTNLSVNKEKKKR